MPKILATDLDGTLFYPKRRITMISKRNLKFIRDFVDNGNKLLIVSGRNVKFAKKVEKKIKRPITFIGCNFSFVYENGTVSNEKCFNGEELSKYLSMIESKFAPTSFVGMSKETNCVIRMLKLKRLYKIGYPIYNLFQGCYRESYKMGEKVFNYEVAKNDIFKCMVLFGLSKRSVAYTSIVNKYLNTFEPFCEISWSGRAIELTPKGCSKSEGIDWYLKEHNCKAEDLYVVGDSGNDISMFKKFYNNSFCMNHSHPTVKKYAKTVIGDFEDLRDYILNK